MKTFMKRAVASLLVMALCLSGFGYQKQTAKAAEDNYQTLFTDTLTGITSGEMVGGTFNVSSAGEMVIGIMSETKCAFTYQLKTSTGTVVKSGAVTSTDANWEVEDDIALYMISANVTAGTYGIELVFAENQALIVLAGLLYPGGITQTPQPTKVPYLDTKNITITAGFKDKVTVLDAGSATITYTSSNTRVATVDAKGNITAKKKGTATITVKTSTGYTGTCKVTVKDNVYSTSKLPISRVPSGSFMVDVYKVSYDKKGNLVIKTRMLNNNGRTAKYLKNFKITIKNEKGKKIGVYSAKKKTINLRSGKAKGYTFKIKKSKLKIKSKQDLYNMSVPRVSGKYYYSIR